MPTGYRTCLEKQCYGYLCEIGLVSGVDFYEQYPASGFVLDFAFIKSYKPFIGVDLEVDGVKWHYSPKQRQKDGFRTHKLQLKGWSVERLGEIFTISDVENILVKHNLL